MLQRNTCALDRGNGDVQSRKARWLLTELPGLPLGTFVWFKRYAAIEGERGGASPKNRM
jgi:hypothetical protein